MPLSDSLTVTIGDIGWPGYCALKDKFLDLLTGDVLTEVAKLLATPIASAFFDGFRGVDTGDAKLGDPIADSVVAIQSSLPSVATSLRDFVSTFDTEFVLACIVGEIDEDLFASLTARQMMHLRDTAYELNDPAELLELEKNFLAGVANSVVTLIGTSQSSTPAGEPSTSTGLPLPTDGDPETSTA